MEVCAGHEQRDKSPYSILYVVLLHPARKVGNERGQGFLTAVDSRKQGLDDCIVMAVQCAEYQRIV